MRDTRIVRGRHAPEKAELARQARKEPTPTEKRLWAFLRAGRLGGLHFRQQQVIDGFIADFYCHSAKLAIEVDGAVHNDRQEYDAERDEIMKALGIRVLRITASDIERDIQSVLQRIQNEARRDT